MRVITNYEEKKQKQKQKSKDKSDLAVPENSDSQAVLLYYEIGSVKNLDAVVLKFKVI